MSLGQWWLEYLGKRVEWFSVCMYCNSSCIDWTAIRQILKRITCVDVDHTGSNCVRTLQSVDHLTRAPSPGRWSMVYLNHNEKNTFLTFFSLQQSIIFYAFYVSLVCMLFNYEDSAPNNANFYQPHFNLRRAFKVLLSRILWHQWLLWRLRKTHPTVQTEFHSLPAATWEYSCALSWFPLGHVIIIIWFYYYFSPENVCVFGWTHYVASILHEQL